MLEEASQEELTTFIAVFRKLKISALARWTIDLLIILYSQMEDDLLIFIK